MHSFVFEVSKLIVGLDKNHDKDCASSQKNNTDTILKVLPHVYIKCKIMWIMFVKMNVSPKPCWIYNPFVFNKSLTVGAKMLLKEDFSGYDF